MTCRGLSLILLFPVIAALVDNVAGQTPSPNNNKAPADSISKSSAVFTDDFSVRSWATGPSAYGKMWYDKDEYRMHAVHGGFIVMYGPDAKDYSTENAIVTVTAHSVQESSPPTGYGVVVHGEKKKGKLEDYGFLVYSGPIPKYKIVKHKGGAEITIARWTESHDIRPSKAANLLEVRITDRNLAFYINGQFQTAITDDEGWLRGSVGFYTSDVEDVAFDDLVIRHDTPSNSGSTQSRNERDILEAVGNKSDLYPATADAGKEIDEALKRAATEKKRLLLIFGANWCYDCHVLDHALHDGDAGKIVTEKFLLVHVDIGEGAKNGDLISKYKIPLDKGVPAVAVLDANGKLLYSSGDGEVEAARKMMKKDLVAFLQHWKP